MTNPRPLLQIICPSVESLSCQSIIPNRLLFKFAKVLCASVSLLPIKFWDKFVAENVWTICTIYRLKKCLGLKKYNFHLTLKILSAVFGTAAGEYVGTMSVNSSAKLLTSNSSPMRGLNGAAIFFCDNNSQSTICKKMLTSALTKRLVIKKVSDLNCHRKTHRI